MLSLRWNGPLPRGREFRSRHNYAIKIPVYACRHQRLPTLFRLLRQDSKMLISNLIVASLFLPWILFHVGILYHVGR